MEPHEIEPKMLDSIEKLGHYGLLYAKWKAESWELQRNEKNLVALLMKKSEAKTSAGQERDAYSSDDYKNHVIQTAKAIRFESEAQHKRDYHYAMFEAMRSLMSLSKKMWEST